MDENQMKYDEMDRSKLELHFQDLFNNYFGKVDELLIPQYKVKHGDQIYRIDYAYIKNDKKVAIELDGFSKIGKAANSSKEFKNLLKRQNHIVSAGFAPLRLTWDDVVKDNGEEAICSLEEALELERLPFEIENILVDQKPYYIYKGKSIKALSPIETKEIIFQINASPYITLDLKNFLINTINNSSNNNEIMPPRSQVSTIDISPWLLLNSSNKYRGLKFD